MRLLTTEKWDEGFFDAFVRLRNSVHESHAETSAVLIPETVSEFRDMCADGKAFGRHNEWEAAMILGGDGNPVSRLFVSRPREWAKEKFIPAGYFEGRDDAAAAGKLFDWAVSWAAQRGHREVRGPIQGNFFRSYRLRKPGGLAPFYGEPVVPAYYHEMFLKNGWSACGHWTTVSNSLHDNLVNTAKIKDKVLSKAHPDFTMRDLDPGNWDKEMELFHRMLSDSFSGMADFMPISIEEFKELYGSFKYIMRKDLSFVLESGGEPVGFMVAYFDPLPIMLAAQRSKMPWKKLVALWRLRRNTTNLLIPYVGKLKGKREVKGVIGILGHELLTRVAKYGADFLACYIADGSMTFGSISKNTKVHAEYVLYSKKWESV